MRRPPVPFLLGVAALWASLGALLAGCSSPSAPAAPAAPEFRLQTMEGREARLSDYRGKVVLLHFWATWCRPCVDAIPHENELAERYGEKGFVVLGMNLDRSEEEVERFLEDNEVRYPVLRVDRLTREAYEVASLPTTVLLDREGRVRRREVGARSGDRDGLTARIERLLEGG